MQNEKSGLLDTMKEVWTTVYRRDGKRPAHQNEWTAAPTSGLRNKSTKICTWLLVAFNLAEEATHHPTEKPLKVQLIMNKGHFLFV